MRKFWLWATMALLALAPAAWAQQYNDISIDIQEVDTDRDGKISSTESAAYIRKLQAEEEARKKPANIPLTYVPVKNEPSVAAPQELAKPAPVVEQPKKIEPEKKEWVRRTDVNKNDQKEYNNRQDEMKAMDADGDGVLQRGELQKSVGDKFDAADTNKDGALSQDETAAALEKLKADKTATQGKAEAAQQANRVKNKYKQADENRDGQVSREEYTSFMNERQDTFDRDGDGIITEDEYRTDGEKVPSWYRKKD